MTMYAVYAGLFFTAAPFNLCLVYVILRNRPIRTITNSLVASLAISDLLLGVFVLPFEIHHFTTTKFNPDGYSCVLHQCVQVYIPSVSVAHLLVITIDRFVKIVYPLKYVNMATKSRVTLSLLAIWLLPLILTSLPMLGWNNIGSVNGTDFTDAARNITGCSKLETLPCSFQSLIFVLVLATIVVMLVLYKKIFSISSLQARRIAAVTLDRRPTGNMMTAELKLVVVLLVTVGFFSLSWLPLGLVAALQCTGKQHPTSEWWTASFFLAYLNSSLNPLIYGIGNRDIREAFQQSFLCCSHRCHRGRVRPLQAGSVSLDTIRRITTSSNVYTLTKGPERPGQDIHV